MHSAVLAAHLHHHVRGPNVDYIGVGVAAALSWIGIPGPGEAALVAAGIAAARGRLDIAAVLAVAWVGATAGGVGGWLVGVHGGRRVVLAGRWLRAARERALERGERFFDRFGWVAVYFAPSWAAGINGMRPSRFLPANAVSALLWAVPIGLGAYEVGPSVREIADDVGLFGVVAVAVLGAAVAVAARVGLRRRRGGRPPRA